MRSRVLLVLSLIVAFGCALRSEGRPMCSVTQIDNSAGLSSNNVKAICQDRFGFMWLGTKNGLNRYDGMTMRRYNCYDTGLGRGNNNISALYEDDDDHLWVGTDRGVYVYDMRTELFNFLSIKTKEGIGAEDWVSAIKGDHDGNIWILIPNQGVFKVGKEKMEFFSVTNHGGDKNRLPQLMVMVNGVPYVGTSFQGLYYYDSQSGRFREAGSPEVRERIRGLSIDVMGEFDDSRLLFGTGKCNVYSFDVNSEELNVIPVKNTNYYLRTIMAVDDEVWLGTQDGVLVHDLTTGDERDLSRKVMGKDGISDNMIYSLYADNEGNVWVGTMFGGVNYVQRKGLIFETFSGGITPRSLSGELVRGLASTPDGKVWVGLEDGGIGCLDTKTGMINTHLPGFPEKELSMTMKSCGNKVYVGLLRKGLQMIDESGRVKDVRIQDGVHSVYAVLEDSRGNLWTGLEWGLYLRRSGSTEFEEVDEIGFDWICDIHEGADGRVWIASMGNGVWTYDPSDGSYSHYAFDENYSNGLRSNSVSAVSEDRSGNIWISTDRGGLSRYMPDTDSFITYGIQEGLPDNVVYDVLEDKGGNLWFGTNNGLVKFDPSTGEARTFVARFGDMVQAFNYASAAEDADGLFYFGGKGGMVSFDPMCDTIPCEIPGIYLTGMKLGNDIVVPGQEGAPIQESLLYTDRIEMPFTRGVISFGVGFPNFSSHNAVVYSYRLLPGDDEWITVSDPTNLSFINLAPGKYTLEIKADCGSQSTFRPYTLSVLPPWYATWWAWLVYMSLFGGLVWSAWKYYRARQDREMIKRAKLMSISQEKELYKSKIQFFTEIAHEIRTPLSLIGSPLEAIDEIGVNDERVERYLKTIRLNTNRLLDLTSHLLDFQKIDREEHSLKFANVDVTAMIQEIVTRFELTMSLKNKNLSVHIPNKPIMATIDVEAITKIVSNLFNNALKYSNGKIDIRLSAGDGTFRLEVASDGEQIAADERLNIFQPFYQIERSGHAGGVGIGLPLSATLAKLHSGSLVLSAESVLSNTFVLEIPLMQDGVEPEIDNSPVKADYVLEEENSLGSPAAGYSLLLVEDNDEMREFLSGQLDKSFCVETAPDGAEALRLISDRKFDIIVTDIMMPVMDGYELCSKIKENPDTSNIPVVFLTAKNDLDSKVKALKCGGESYIEKPFSIKFFRQQIMSLLDNRQNERNAFLKKPFFTVENMKLNKADEEFMNKVIAIINENISDENFSVETIADTFCMSRSSLLRRIKALFNLSPVELIRVIKLKKAAELIQEGKYRIGDVCYMVGINSSSYFSKLFFRQFGVTPKVFEKQCQANSQAANAAKEKLEC